MNLQGSRTRARQERQNERFLTTGPNCRADTDSDPPCPSPNALQPPPQTHHPSHPRSLALPQPHALHTTTLSSRTLRRTLRNCGTPPPVLPAVQTAHLDDRVLLRQPDVSRRGGGWGGIAAPTAPTRPDEALLCPAPLVCDTSYGTVYVSAVPVFSSRRPQIVRLLFA